MHTEEIQNITRQEGNLHDFLSCCYQIKLNSILPSLQSCIAWFLHVLQNLFVQLLLHHAIASGKVIRN